MSRSIVLEAIWRVPYLGAPGPGGTSTLTTCPIFDLRRCRLAGTGAELIVIEVTDETFAADVLEADRPVVVDFWAPWCGPCKAVGRVLEELEAAHGERIGFVKVNIDEHPLNAADHRRALAADGDPLRGRRSPETVVGARSRSHFERQFADWL